MVASRPGRRARATALSGAAVGAVCGGPLAADAGRGVRLAQRILAGRRRRRCGDGRRGGARRRMRDAQAFARSAGRRDAGRRRGAAHRRAGPGAARLDGTTTDRVSAAAACSWARLRRFEVRRRRPMLNPDMFASHRFFASIAGRCPRPCRDRADELLAGADAARAARRAYLQRARCSPYDQQPAGRCAGGALAAFEAAHADSPSDRTRVAAAGEAALTDSMGASWTRLVPGLIVTGIGTASPTPRSAGSQSSRFRATARAWEAAPTTQLAISGAPPGSRWWSASSPGPARADWSPAGTAQRLFPR